MPRKVRVPAFAALRQLARDPEGRILLGTAISTVTVGTVVYMVLEGWDWIDALYFSVVTLATVGFGDLHPTTNEAKLFTVAYILFGVGIIAGFVSALAKRRTERATTPVLDRVERVQDAVASMARRGREEPSSAQRGDDEPASAQHGEDEPASAPTPGRPDEPASAPRPPETTAGAGRTRRR